MHMTFTYRTVVKNKALLALSEFELSAKGVNLSPVGKCFFLLLGEINGSHDSHVLRHGPESEFPQCSDDWLGKVTPAASVY
jgi:hypothetical protein